MKNYLVQGQDPPETKGYYDEHLRVPMSCDAQLGAAWPSFAGAKTHSIAEYCMEEVRRQDCGWTSVEYAQRVAWMLRAWVHAATELAAFTRPSVNSIIVLGKMVEPDANAVGLRNHRVGILASGGRVMPIGSDVAQVRKALEALCGAWETLTPLAWYRTFEEVHPFADGNGRVGKILLNWRNGTLLQDPVFPPADFWGASIVNP